MMDSTQPQHAPPSFPMDEYEDEQFSSDHTTLLINNEPSTMSGHMDSGGETQQPKSSSSSTASSGWNESTSAIMASVLPFFRSRHPIALFFHVFFKVAALLSYLLLTIFTSNFVLVFVTCILLLAFDFWTVKNISGRLLVGLRWWNEVQPDGQSVWRFESKEDRSDIDPLESNVFWITLYAYPLVWILLGVVCIVSMRLQWLMIIGFALVLSISNLVGYFKCQRDATSKLSEWIVKQSFVQSLVIRLLGSAATR